MKRIKNTHVILKITMIFILVYAHVFSSFAQSEFLYTKSFSKKVDKHQLEFYQPVERWMKVSPIKHDEFMKYDVVLHSPPNVEVRISIDKDGPSLFPNVEIVRLMSHIASNHDDSVIEYTEYPSRYASDYYGADLVLYADFDPKESYSSYPNGRMLILYKEGEALVKYIILYQGKLDAYFNLPLRFGKKADVAH